MIVAVDGPAASGKGTLARGIAARFGFSHLDTGLLYRAVARGLLDACAGAQDRAAAVRIASGLDVTTLDQRPGLRAPEVDALVSTVAAWPELRDSIIHLQREFAARPPGGAPGAVLDGRDIGSVVVPDADVKIFVTADLETRAERRRLEIAGQGLPADSATVLEAIRARDRRDEDRLVAPLCRAPGAHLLDTTDLGIGEAVDKVAAIIAEHLNQGRNAPFRGPSARVRTLPARTCPNNKEACMEPAAQDVQPKLAAPSIAEFEAMVNESFEKQVPQEGTVVDGQVIGIENNQAIIDVGFKTEGRVDLKEFARPGRAFDPTNVQVGDTVSVYLDRIENVRGEAVLSREKANREVAWDRLESANTDELPVEGVIFGRVKGGFSVDLGGAVAFLPGSQVDVRPMNDVTSLMDQPLKFQIVKMDRRRGNVVVSRRAVLEKTTSAERARVIERLNRGDIVEGAVKNIVDFGAFVDLGGIDGLLHVTDMAWRRVNHPSEIVSVGDVVRVQVLKVNRETQRISLGRKQLEPDPWDGIAAKYPAGMRIIGRVANITEFGAFVELEPGVEGLIHISEMSWTKKNMHPGKIVSTSQEVEVMVLNSDSEKRRISLGLKQCMDNPWEVFAATHPAGARVEGPVRTITEFGLFIGLDDGIDGMVHLSDLSWEMPGEEAIKQYSKGDTVEAVVLQAEVESERISLGIKQLQGDPFAQATAGLKRGSVVSAVVSGVKPDGIDVEVGGVKVFIRKQDLAHDRVDQRPDRFAQGDRLEAQVSNINRSAHTLSLSIRSLEVSREKEAVRQYGSAAAGAVLGDILAPALGQRGGAEEKAADSGAEAPPAAAGQKAATRKAAGAETPGAATPDEAEAAGESATTSEAASPEDAGADVPEAATAAPESGTGAQDAEAEAGEDEKS